MKNRFILSFILLVLSHFSVLSAESISAYNSAEIQKADQPDLLSTSPTGNAVLISFPYSGKTSADFRDQLPTRNSEENTKESVSLDRSERHSYRNSSSVYLRLSEQLVGSQNTRKLIFPFHTYL